MNGTTKTILVVALVAFLAGGAAGWTLAQRGAVSVDAAPTRWVARIDDRYISADEFIEEMRHHGGERPGQFQSLEQKRKLLDELVLRAALVKSAEKAGLLAQPELRRSIAQVISNRYLQDTLRQTQRAVQVSDEEVRQYYETHADEYTVPARKRVAMLKITVAADAGEPAWKSAMERMQKARVQASKLDKTVPHFGTLAREISDDSGSRYRGGVIGWIAEGRSDRYNYDPVVIEATRKLDEAGSLSEVLRGADGVYLVRLVEGEPRQARGLDLLANGIRQRLLQDRLAESERQFQEKLIHEVGVEVRESVLAAITPLSPPAGDSSPQPPAMPKDQG